MCVLLRSPDGVDPGSTFERARMGGRSSYKRSNRFSGYSVLAGALDGRQTAALDAFVRASSLALSGRIRRLVKKLNGNAETEPCQSFLEISRLIGRFEESCSDLLSPMLSASQRVRLEEIRSFQRLEAEIVERAIALSGRPS